MILNSFALIFCIFTSYFVFSITESKQSFFRVPGKQCPAISPLAAGKVVHLIHMWTKTKREFKTARVYSLVIRKSEWMVFCFLTCIISCHCLHSVNAVMKWKWRREKKSPVHWWILIRNMHNSLEWRTAGLSFQKWHCNETHASFRFACL